jgi:hypothetical protein
MGKRLFAIAALVFISGALAGCAGTAGLASFVPQSQDQARHMQDTSGGPINHGFSVQDSTPGGPGNRGTDDVGGGGGPINHRYWTDGVGGSGLG